MKSPCTRRWPLLGLALSEHLIVVAMVSLGCILAFGLLGKQIKLGVNYAVGRLSNRAASGDAISASELSDAVSVTTLDTGPGRVDGSGNDSNGQFGGGSNGAVGGNAGLIDAKSAGNVPAIKQPNDMACWATAGTMMLSWKESKTLEIKDVVARAGQKFSDIFNAQKGVSGIQLNEFNRAIGMYMETPQNYTVAGWQNLIDTHGPLSVGTALGGGAHVWVITGIHGDGTPNGTFFSINDPWTGGTTSQSVDTFQSNFEEIARRNGSSLNPQVGHF